MSMAARSSNLEDRMSGANLQTEGHVGVQSQCQKGPEEMAVSDSSSSHLPSWSPPRRPPPNHPNTRYYLVIHVTLTRDRYGTPLSNTWTAPLVEDMLHSARTGITEATVTGPGRAVYFYGRHSLGKGLSPDRSRNTTFMLTGVGTWVGKPAYIATGTLTIQEEWWKIAKAITKCQIKARGPGHPCMNLSTPQPFRID